MRGDMKGGVLLGLLVLLCVGQGFGCGGMKPVVRLWDDHTPKHAVPLFERAMDHLRAMRDNTTKYMQRYELYPESKTKKAAAKAYDALRDMKKRWL